MDRAGIPAVVITTLISVARNVGANRIVPGTGVPHVVGDPQLEPAQETALRRKLVERALEALATPIEEQSEF